MAKIHSIEWTPAILPNQGLDLGLNANWYGMLTYMFRKPGRRRTVVRDQRRNAGARRHRRQPHRTSTAKPFGLAEEFVEVYRLHSLLPETLRLRRHDTGGVDRGPALRRQPRQAGSPKVTARGGR